MAKGDNSNTLAWVVGGLVLAGLVALVVYLVTSSGKRQSKDALTTALLAGAISGRGGSPVVVTPAGQSETAQIIGAVSSGISTVAKGIGALV